MEYINDNIFHFKKSAFTYYGKCGLYAIIGIGLGLLIERICKKIQSQYKPATITTITMIVLQLFMIISTLYIIEIYVSGQFAIEWQNTTPGFMFVALFFNLQPTLISNITALSPF